MAIEIREHCYRCGDKPMFTAPRRTPNGVEVVWACGTHNRELEREELLDVYGLVPICQAGGKEPCGEAATHIVIDPELRPISTCAEHAKRV
jgi:hypothetical protein